MRSSTSTLDLETIRGQIDLVALIAAELGQPQRSGAWLKWRCPFHADKTPSLAVGPDRRLYKCFGCGVYGDVFEWLQKRRNLSFPEAKAEAAKIAGLSVGDVAPRARAPQIAPQMPVSRAPEPPSQQWQGAAWEFVTYAQDQLWAHADGTDIALPYLYKRGLENKTLTAAGLGWCPGLQGQPAKWGLAESRLILPRGVVIPMFYGPNLWGVKIRRFGARSAASERKYLHVTGGGDTWPYGADTCTGCETVLLTEGEFDQLLALQEVGDLVDVLALKSLRAEWISILQPYARILAAYDRDQAGKNFGRALVEKTARARLLSVPLESDKADLTKFYQSGGDLRLWLQVQLRRAG